MFDPESWSDDDQLVLLNVHKEGEDFAGRTLKRIAIGAGSRFVRCDFRRTRVTSGGLGGGLSTTEYVECLFDGSKLRRIIPGISRFERCSFLDVTIIDFRCHEAEFVECVFSGRLNTVIFDARVEQAEDQVRLGRTVNEYQGNDFSGAKLYDVAFRGGVDLGRQILPSGPEYLVIVDASAKVVAARQAVQRWPAGEVRESALDALELVESEAGFGQRDVFVRRAELGDDPEGRLAELLDG